MKKICSRCEIERDLGEFSASSSSICKDCNKAYQSEYRKKKAWDGRIVASKKCSSCNTVFSADKFYSDKSRSDGLSNRCKVCVKAYRKRNRDKILEQSRKYNRKRAESEKIKVTGRVCAQCGKYKESKYFWKSKHTKDGLYPACIECKKKQESTDHRKAVKSKNKKDWRINNIDKARRISVEWEKSRKAKDPSYRVGRNVMHAISNKLQGKFFDKQERLVKKIFDYLPYTSEELKLHIESKWEDWMSWKNYGKYNEGYKTWQIDHIIPQSKLPYEKFEDENFVKCWSLDNLQPLETVENITKGNLC